MRRANVTTGTAGLIAESRGTPTAPGGAPWSMFGRMNPPDRRAWIGRLVLAGAAYVVIGVVFSALDDSPDPTQVRRWRLAAWAVSAAVAAVHLWYEVLRSGTPPVRTALRAAAAVGIGAFGLAAAAIIHSTGTGHRLPIIALAAWPLLTAIPAFLAALAIAAGLARLARRHQP
jgi:drug/metabolite transporter (DMT)-like permease